MGKLQEFLTDEKFIKLYQTMTQSNYKGDLADCFLVEWLYATMTLDLVNGSEEFFEFKPKVLKDVSKEVLRIFETENHTSSMFSIANWSMALIKYMRENGLEYKDIHRRNTYELREEVRKYLKEGEE